MQNDNDDDREYDMPGAPLWPYVVSLTGALLVLVISLGVGIVKFFQLVLP